MTSQIKLSYQDYAKGISFLPVEDQVKLLELILSTLKTNLQTVKPKHSIMEFEGLGADIWNNIDVNEYIRKERDSWS